MPEGKELTVDIPGFEEVFTLFAPFSDDEETKKERLRRFLSRESPVPESLQWIPSAINFLDDVQDFLIVGLFLARPILRRLPHPALAGLGWALTVSDTLDFGTRLLVRTQTPILTKADWEKQYRKIARNRAARLNAASAFLRKYPLGSFVLQAGQVLDNLTGHGLRLGPIMGMVADSVWGTARAIGGERVVVRTPPISDMTWQQWHQFVKAPLSQTDALSGFSVLAARVLAQSATPFIRPDLFSANEMAMSLAGINMAISEVTTTWNEIEARSRAETAAEFKVPLFLRQDPVTVETMRRTPIPQGVDKRIYYWETEGAPLSVARATESLFQAQGDYGKFMKANYFNRNFPQGMAQYIYGEIDQTLFDEFIAPTADQRIATYPWEWTLQAYAKHQVTVEGSYSPAKLASFYMAVANAMLASGFCADWIGWSQWIWQVRELAADQAAFGGWPRFSWRSDRFLGTGPSCPRPKRGKGLIDWDAMPGWPGWFRTLEVGSQTKTALETGWGGTAPGGTRVNPFAGLDELPDRITLTSGG